MLEESGGCEAAVSRRIRASWTKYRELSGVLVANDIPERLKGMLYNVYIRPVAAYGSETWPLRLEEEKRLQRMEIKMLRWMIGGEVEEKEVRGRLGVVDIGMVMRRSRLRWLGHVERRDEQVWTKKIRTMEVYGSRPKGRPRMSWSHVVERDLRAWRMKVEDSADRSVWKDRLFNAMREVYPQSV